MARLYLFAEGLTEQTFADRLLKPHLANFGVYLHPPVLIAHARRHRRVHRGGGRNYLPMKNDIQRFLAQEKSGNVFPGLAESERLRSNPVQRVEFLEQSFAQDLADRRFVPYIQLHEYEAYLFADPIWFGYFYEQHDKQIAALQAIADQFETPELINDGLQSAPSKRIMAQLPDYEDAKAAIGSQVAELIGLNTIRAKCKHFANWLARLESLGQQPDGAVANPAEESPLGRWGVDNLGL